LGACASVFNFVASLARALERFAAGFAGSGVLDSTVRILSTLDLRSAACALAVSSNAKPAPATSLVQALGPFAATVFDGVIGRFLRNGDVMWMALPHAGG